MKSLNDRNREIYHNTEIAQKIKVKNGGKFPEKCILFLNDKEFKSHYAILNNINREIAKLKIIIEEVIEKDPRPEASKILYFTSPKRVREFLDFFKKENFNICCMHLDLIKNENVEKGLMKQNEDDKFGGKL